MSYFFCKLPFFMFQSLHVAFLSLGCTILLLHSFRVAISLASILSCWNLHVAFFSDYTCLIHFAILLHISHAALFSFYTSPYCIHFVLHFFQTTVLHVATCKKQVKCKSISSNPFVPNARFLNPLKNHSILLIRFFRI